MKRQALSLLNLLVFFFCIVSAFAQQTYISTQPQRWSSSALGTTNIQANFSNIVDPLDFNDDSIVVRGLYSGARTQLLGTTITGLGTSTMTINPGKDFLPGEPVSIYAATGLSDTSGAPIPIGGRRQDYFVTRSTGGTGAFRQFDLGLQYQPHRESSATGDFNGDGRIDLLIMSNSGFTVLSSAVGPGWTVIGGGMGSGTVRDVKADDMDMDGDLDVVICTSSSKIEVWANNGTASFSLLTNVQAQSVESINIVDVDRDGDMDVMGYHNSFSNVYRAYINNGTGNLVAASSGFGQYVGRSPQELVFLDDDMFPIGADATGNKVGSNGGLIAAVSGGPSAVSVGDVDGDQLGDLVVGKSDSRQVVILKNLGSWNYIPIDSFDVGLLPSAIKLIDIDGDLDLDIVAASKTSDLITVAKNDGNGNFTFFREAHPGIQPSSISAGDFDGDGDQDLLLACSYNSTGFQYVYMLNDTFPQVIDAVPAVNAAGVAPNTNISVNWSDNMGASAATPATFVVEGELSGAMTPLGNGTYTGTGTSALNFAANTPFIAGEVVRIKTTNAVFSASGDKAEYSFASQFMVKSLSGALDFEAGTPVQGSTGADLCMAADFDRDGKVDLATASSVGFGFSAIRLNRGCNRWLNHVDSFWSASVFDMLSRDFNLDGFPDIAIANGGRLDVFLNDGLGQFPTANTTLPFTNVRSLCAGDFTGNGAEDLMLTNSIGNSYLIRNDGAGNFSSSINDRYNGTGLQGAKAGDMDNDGDIDFVSISAQYDEAIVMLNTREAPYQFHIANRALVGVDPGELELADFDGNGFLDVVTASSVNGSVSVRFNDGHGILDSGFEITGMPIVTKIKAGDLNGDNFPDLAMLLPSVDSFRIYLNNGSGGFTYLKSVLTTLSSKDLIIADFDGDQALDVATVDDQTGKVSIYENTYNSFSLNGMVEMPFAATIPANGPIAFDFSSNLPAVPAPNTLFVHGDYEGLIDGSWTLSGPQRYSFAPTDPFLPGQKLNISITNCLADNGGGVLDRPYSVEYITATAPAAGIFIQKPPVQAWGTKITTIAVADLDNDGVLELATTNADPSEDSLVVLENDGAGNLTILRSYYAPYWVTAVKAVDYDQDGTPDLVTSGSISNTLVKYKNSGNGTFTLDGLHSTNTRAFDFSTGDFDIDGDQDFLVAEIDYGSGSSSAANLIYNDGTGYMSYLPQNSNGSRTIVMTDLNSDFYLDGVSGSNQGMKFMFNNTKGGIDIDNSGLSMPFVTDLATADLNNDQFPDLVQLNLATNDVSVYFNNGVGIFTLSQSFMVPFPRQCAVGDLDGDGDMDVVVTAVDANQISILWNNGNGTFANPFKINVQMNTDALALGDFNGDRKLDIAVGGSQSTAVVLLLNDNTIAVTEAEANRSIQIVPNPNTGEMTVFPSGWGKDAAKLTVRDLTGRTVYQMECESGTTPLPLDLTALPSGVYLLEMQQGNTFMHKNFSVQR